jgi:crotonobetainyl-CoA:carnitine CoA-transferase CaiB-like acyl-CoA transferase
MTDRVAISRKELTNVIDDYRVALGRVNDAAQALENAALQMGGMGFEFNRRSVQVIDHTNNLYVEINQIIGRLREVTPDE